MFEEESLIPPHIIFLGLIQIDGVGFQTIYNFFHQGKCLIDLMRSENLNDFDNFLGRKLSVKYEKISDLLFDIVDKGQKLFEDLYSRNIKFLLYGDYHFPNFPLNMKKPIYWLFVEGKLDNLHTRNAFTLIGSRESTGMGGFLAQTLLFGLSEVKEPIVTISGLATGIDQIVHEISILLDIPTIAVLGTGINENYPANSRRLREEIIQHGGTIVTEYFPNMKPTKDSFINRNRIQAALSMVVIPLEWKKKSGTAHTIRFAHDMEKRICFVETSVCRRLYSDHAAANLDAQKNYGGDIFVLPNAINDLISSLNISSSSQVFSLKISSKTKDVSSSKQPTQIGLDF